MGTLIGYSVLRVWPDGIGIGRQALNNLGIGEFRDLGIEN